MRGDELLREARAVKRLESVPFVVLSSSTESVDVEQCLALGASEYAVKPIDFKAYGERVCGLVHRWLAGAEEAPSASSDGDGDRARARSPSP